MAPVLGLYESPHGDVLSAAFRAGALARGWVVRRRSANDFKRGDTEPFDLAFLYSLRSRGADELLEGFARVGVPVVVMDYGYIKRACQEAFGGGGEYWQVGIGGLNSLPDFACPSDRFDALGIDIKAKGGDPEGYVLVAGQHNGDPSHGRTDADGLRRWAVEQCTFWQGQGVPVAFRSHPFSPTIAPDVEGLVTAPADLDAAIAGARLVVVQTSNLGHDALLAGVPVCATSERAPYAELSSVDLPSVEERRAYFNRVAYGQWTLAELAAGDWLRFYEDALLPGAFPDKPVPELVAESCEVAQGRKRRRS